VLTTVLALIVVLGVLIFVHEAGHFIAAKWAGIYVHRFSLGLGPPIPWLTFRRGETEYSISWLPLGGYVKMASREEDIGSSALEGGVPTAAVPPDRVFEAKPIWKRMVVILAGVTMNALFAWIVFAGLVYKNGRQIDPVTVVGRVVPELVPKEAAALKQIAPGSRILRINGDSVKSWDEVVSAIANTSDPEVRIELAGGSTVVLPIHPDALEERIRQAGGPGGDSEGRYHSGGQWSPDPAVVRPPRRGAGECRTEPHAYRRSERRAARLRPPALRRFHSGTRW
jgi:regulator of sigma E protease